MQAKVKFQPRGYTLVEIMLIVTIISLLAVIAVCNFIIARDTSRLALIRTNLKDIATAKQQWALENKKSIGDTVADVEVLTKYLPQGRVTAVTAEHYNPNAIGTPPTALLPEDMKLGQYGPGSTIPAP